MQHHHLDLYNTQVYKGRRKCSGQIVALKFIMKHGKSEKDVRNLRQEIEILRKLKHENIIQMLDAFETSKEFCVVTEFAQGMLGIVHSHCNMQAAVRVCEDDLDDQMRICCTISQHPIIQ